MSEKRKITLVVEGHRDRVDAFQHELSKLVSEGNSQPELEISMHSEPILEQPEEEQ